MTNIDTNAIGTTATTATTAASSKTNSSEVGKDAFLKLLVAQLKYQDPLNPTEGAEFMAQTAQFTMVEKLTELAEVNAELLAGQRTLSGSSLIGRTVTFPGPDGFDTSGVVDGVRITTDGAVLRVGDQDVPLGSVKEVAATAAATTTGSAPTTEPEQTDQTDQTDPATGTTGD